MPIICTKESASAPALSDRADAAQSPTSAVPAKATPMSEVPTARNYAGGTYQKIIWRPTRRPHPAGRRCAVTRPAWLKNADIARV
jgi:hypothetical protein